MASSDDAITLLWSIDTTLKTMLALAQQRTSQVRAAQPKAVADDHELDSKYGDEQVRLNPRDWTGPSFKGLHMSECPADFLDLLADSYDYFARKNDETGAITDKGKPKSEFDRRSERRARGWAKRQRAERRPSNGSTGHTTSPEWNHDDGF